MPRALRAPYRFTKAFHHIVHRCVFVTALRDELPKYSTDAGGVVYRKLLGDREVHRHVQKRIGAAVIDRVLARKRGVKIIEVGVILGMLQHPVERNRFQR